jgi:hypothetical protein
MNTYHLIDTRAGWSIALNGREVVGGSDRDLDEACEALHELNGGSLIG